jgi:hypothetical protein
VPGDDEYRALVRHSFSAKGRGVLASVVNDMGSTTALTAAFRFLPRWGTSSMSSPMISSLSSCLVAWG